MTLMYDLLLVFWQEKIQDIAKNKPISNVQRSILRTTFLGFRNVICCRWRIKNVSSLAISLDFIKGSASHGSLEYWGRVKKKPCKEQRRLFLKVVSGNSWNQSRWIFWLTRKIAAACQGLPHKKGQRWKFWIMFWKKSKLIGSNNHMCKTFRDLQKNAKVVPSIGWLYNWLIEGFSFLLRSQNHFINVKFILFTHNRMWHNYVCWFYIYGDNTELP